MRLPTFVCISVCLSVCLLARLLKNVFMDLDEMLHVDRCWDIDELINFWAWCQNRIASPLSYNCWYVEFYVRKIRCIHIGRCSNAWFYNGFIHWASESSNHLCRRYMHSTECPASCRVIFQRSIMAVDQQSDSSRINEKLGCHWEACDARYHQKIVLN